jgi:ABC-type nickel/cobalt efflux system permease component RcnA
MSSTAWILVAVAAALIVAGLVAWWLVREQRSRRLRQTFGPEYDRTIADAPTRREAEEDLADRRRRREELDIRPLPAAARDRYLFEWRGVQERFVEDPASAIGEADDLIQQVMRERGYPVEDFDRRAADLSVDHADVVEHYREGHAIAKRNLSGEADTEELRQAMVHYRALFDDMLEAATDAEEAKTRR